MNDSIDTRLVDEASTRTWTGARSACGAGRPAATLCARRLSPTTWVAGAGGELIAVPVVVAAIGRSDSDLPTKVTAVSLDRD